MINLHKKTFSRAARVRFILATITPNISSLSRLDMEAQTEIYDGVEPQKNQSKILRTLGTVSESDVI